MSPVDFELIEMTSDDIDAAAKMRLQSWLDTYTNEAVGITYEWIMDRFKNQLDESTKDVRINRFTLAKQKGTFNAWVAKDSEGNIVGSTTPFINEQGGQRVGSIYVDKQWHGRGVGRQLMQKVVDWFDPNKPIELFVATYNQRAKAFYKKWGFEEVPGSEELYDEKIPEIKMIRQPQNSQGETN